MWRLFAQFFPLAIISVIGISTIIVTLTVYFYGERLENDAIEKNSAQILLLQNYLAPNLSEQDWQQRFDEYQSKYTGTIRLVDVDKIDSLSASKKARLLAGETVAAIGPDVALNLITRLYFRINGTEKFILLSNSTLGTYQSDGISLSINFIVLIIFLLFISLWLSFHWSELKKLMVATDQISKGNFSTRVKLKKYASTYLIGDKINQMAAYIERLVNGQRDLIHSVSHELRTPIARLEFGLEMLKEISKNPTLIPRVDDLKTDVAELSDLVNELLQLAAVGQQYLAEPKPFDMASMLHSSLQILKHDRAHKKIVSSWKDNLGKYNGDPRLLERAVRNLLSNADKYSLTQIRLSAKKLFGGGYEIAVDDDGPGIPEEERTHVFEPFYRLENVWDKKISGYGLGLAIVYKVVMVHNGSVYVTQSDLGGARFVIRLP